MNGPQITVVGNVGGDPKLRSLADGTFVTSFSVAMTPSRYDKSREVWVDQETLWFRVTCWRTLAEHAAMSFHKGDKVIVTGSFSTSTWKDKDGVERVTNEIDAVSVGFDVTRGPVYQKRVERVSAAAETTTDPWVDQSPAADPFTGEVIPEQAAPDPVAA